MLYKIKVSHPLINLDGEDEKYFFIEALDEDTAIQQAHQELFLLVPQLFDEYRESVFSIEVLDCSNEGRHCGIENFLIMNNFIFLSFDSNYGDEFDVNGFVIISFADWLDYKAALESYETPFELYFGTNESFKFTNGKDLLRRIKAVSISNSEKLTFEKTTGLSFGWFPIEIYDADGKSIW